MYPWPQGLFKWVPIGMNFGGPSLSEDFPYVVLAEVLTSKSLHFMEVAYLSFIKDHNGKRRTSTL
jgi:hypothetical protein